MHTIETDVLTLEPQRAEHAEEMFLVLSDPAIYEFENQPPASAEWLKERYKKLESRLSADGQEQWLNWVIRLPSGELIGYVQATVQQGGLALIAYELSSRFWGRGLAYTAVKAMITELVLHYEVRTVAAVLKEANYRSLRLLNRLGFSRASLEGRARFAVESDELLMHCEKPGG